MSDAFSVDPEAVADAVARMAGFQWYVGTMLDEIDTAVAGLHATWSGRGASAQAEAHQLWVQGAAMMREALTQLRSAGNVAHANYSSAAAMNKAMWS